MNDRCHLFFPVMAGPGTAELQLGIHPANNLPTTLN